MHGLKEGSYNPLVLLPGEGERIEAGANPLS